MKTQSNIIYLTLLIITSIACTNEKKTTSDLLLQYDQPAQKWEEALPIGNGRLGAMVFGDIIEEHLQLNENTLYSGEPSTAYKNVSISATYDQITMLLKNGKQLEAEELIRKNWLGRLHQNYQPMNDLFIKNNINGDVYNYHRELDLENAIVRVSYLQNGVKYIREIIASHPDNIIAIRLKADKKNKISFTARFTSQHPTAKQSFEQTDNLLIMKGQAPGYVESRTFEQIESWGDQYKHPELYDTNGKRKTDSRILYGEDIDNKGMYFDSRIKVDAKDGKVTVNDKGLTVNEATEVTIYLSAATSFNGYDKSPSREGVDASAKANTILQKASAADWETLLKRHESDYKKLFDRVILELPSTDEQKAMTTDQRIINFDKTNDPGLAALLFQYGRYLMIAGSREGGQPLNLQGIWNNLQIPPWNCGYTMNINTEMNYWPAEVTNLSECHEPLFRLIKEISVTGAEAAQKMYNRNGWVGHHNVSIWREAFPNDNGVRASYWPTVGGWLCSHLWEHFVFTSDTAFLKNEAYPLMKGAATFFLEWLMENENGLLVTPVSTSPENGYVNDKGEKVCVDQGTTMDISIIRELFTRTEKATQLLQTDAEFGKRLHAATAKLLPFQIGSKEQLQEWSKDYADIEPQHRHLSHLYGFYPGDQITWSKTPQLVNAVKKTMEIRGDAATGWSMGWKINIWARMLDGDHAYKIIQNLFNPIGFGDSKKAGGGLYKNLMDACPPFQIDGNFGYTSGIAEMLIQSHEGYIQLLPALPSVWPIGNVSGLKARGNFEVSCSWTNGKINEAAVLSHSGNKCALRLSRPFIVLNKSKKIANSSEVICGEKTYYEAAFETEKGKIYQILNSSK